MESGQNKSKENFINPKMLEWAREWSNVSIEDVAKRFQKRPEEILDWEKNKKTPTVIQARKLAKIYNRHFIDFFLIKPPDIVNPVSLPNYRLHKDAHDPSYEKELVRIQEWATSRREDALDLYQEIGESIPNIPPELFTSKDQSPEEAANIARKTTNIPSPEQFLPKKEDGYRLPSIIREKIESIGILTLYDSKLGKFKIRGMCIANFPLPVIVCSKESPAAKAFTIAHEFAHILLKASGITGTRSRDYEQIPEEKWCDHFAGAFLMPETFIEKEYGTKPDKPTSSISDELLKSLADKFRVSQHAMLVRLVHLGYVEPTYYWGTKKKEFEEWEEKQSSFGRAPYGARYKSQLGELYTGLVIKAWALDKITNHNAAEYMGIENIKHLNGIKEDL